MRTNITKKFFKQGSEFLKVKFPILCGAMAWVSTPELVAAVANSNGFGCLAAANTPADILEKQVNKTRELTDKPFGINLITISPSYHEQLYLSQWMKLPYVIFAGSIPKKNEVKIIKESGAKVICFASTKSIADQMIRYGADALILEGMEAGGHVGRVTLSVLLQQVLFETRDVPIFVAGGIVSPKMCAHLLLMGAAGVQMGTRFAISEESCIHQDMKKLYIRSNSRDAISVPQYDARLPVVPVRTLRNKGFDDFSDLQQKLIEQLNSGKISRFKAQIQMEKYWNGALKNAVQKGDIETGSMMAGQSVGMIKDIPKVSTIMEDLITGIESELLLIKKLL